MTTSTAPRVLIAVALAALTAACGSSVQSTGSPEAGAPVASSPAAKGRTTLVIGSVSDDAKEEAEVFQPFVNHVAKRLATAGVTGGEVVVAATAKEMAALLRAGKVDVYVDSMYGITTVVQDGAGVPLLRRWKDGSPTYRSVVVVRRDSGITSTKQMRGRTVAFDDPDSTDGFFLPAATLLRQGLPLTPLKKPRAKPPADGAGYVFTGDDENTVFQVLDGRVDAGALSEEDLAENAGPRAGELRTLVHTMQVPRHALVARKGLDTELVRALTTELRGMHTTPQGRKVLEAFEETARFDSLSAEAFAPFLGLGVVLRRGTP